VPREPGPRRLRIAAADLAGNRAEEVFSFTVVPPGPEVRLLGLRGPLVLRAGEALPIRWETRGVEPVAPSVLLSVSRDGGQSWSDLARGLPNGGVFPWKAPQEDVSDLRFRIEVEDAYGQVGSAESGRIVVSAQAPKVVLEAVEPRPPRKSSQTKSHEGGE
jgi:hypothetical protein